MIKVVNSIPECYDPQTEPDGPGHYRRKGGWSGVVVHRTESGHDAAGIARKQRHYTPVGRKMAYHFAVTKAGVIEQALPLNVVGWHASGVWGWTRVGIGVIGDFRRHEPTDVQHKALVDLCVWLTLELGETDNLALNGHDELQGASSDPEKVCPGSYLDMDQLRSDVRLFSSGVARCEDAGIVL